MHYVYVMVYISLAVAMQLLTGNFPVSFRLSAQSCFCGAMAFLVMDVV